MTKPNKDGWIRHRGGKCPVDVGALVDVLHRDGEVFMEQEVGEGFAVTDWSHIDEPGDIMAWRPHKPVEQRIIEAEQSALADKCNEEAEMPAAKYFDGPLQWRDRIREIDAASKEEEARHFAAMAAYDAERAYLVAQLKAEGFVLIQGDEPNSEVESAQQDIAQQDMSDPANWRVGDLIECTNGRTKQFTSGNLYLIGYMDNNWVHFYADDSGDENGWHSKHFKWHSRPTN